MAKIIKQEMTKEELIIINEELRAENERLKRDLNCHIANETQLKSKLYYRDGVIHGMKYALRCNGISGGEIDAL